KLNTSLPMLSRQQCGLHVEPCMHVGNDGKGQAFWFHLAHGQHAVFAPHEIAFPEPILAPTAAWVDSLSTIAVLNRYESQCNSRSVCWNAYVKPVGIPGNGYRQV